MEYYSHEILAKEEVDGNEKLNDYWKRVSLIAQCLVMKSWGRKNV